MVRAGLESVSAQPAPDLAALPSSPAGNALVAAASANPHFRTALFTGVCWNLGTPLHVFFGETVAMALLTQASC